jgi:WD40 repeat protein
MSRSDRKAVLEAFRKTLGQELHNLGERPEILWQQMFNRLQWVDSMDSEGPVSRVIASEFKKRISLGAKHWFHNLCRTRESEAFIMILKGHIGSVNCCTFSPNGKILASGSQDQTVRLWNTETGKEKLVLKGHTDGVTFCAFSPDSETIASTSGNRKVWLPSTSGFIPRYSLGGDTCIRLWDVQTGKEKAVLKGHINGVECCAFSPDGRTLISASEDKTVKLWDIQTGKEKVVLAGHTNFVESCVFSPNGKTIASASWDKTIRIWDVQTGKEKAVLIGHTDGIWSCDFSPDGGAIVSASQDKTCRIWDVETGKEKAVLIGHAGPIYS